MGEPTKNDTQSPPDPLALELARGLQDAITPDRVILYGSRAAGEHHPYSDVDLLVITRTPVTGPVHPAAQTWLNATQPQVDVNIRVMTQRDFDHGRRLGQSIAGQATRYGVNPMGEKLEHNTNYNPHDEEIWQETRPWLERSSEHMQDYNEREDSNHWNLKTLGYEAQQAVEHAMKGLLAAHNDQGRFRHDLSRMWEYIDQHLPWTNEPDAIRGKVAIGELIDHVTSQHPNSSQQFNWLTAFAEEYRYEVPPRERTSDERKDLQYLVNNAVTALQEEALRRRGTTQEDLFPQGKPWER